MGYRDDVRRAAHAVPGWETAVVVGWFAAFTVLASFFPRSGDDWPWGSGEGIARLHIFFAGINGRYAGDFAVLGLTRAGLLTPVVVSLVVTATLVLVLELSRNRTPVGYGLVGVLFLAMPVGLWREGVVWLSGFSNYVLGALTLLLFLLVVRGEWEGEERRPRPLTMVVTFVVAVIGQLFMEYVTLAIVVLSVGSVVVVRRRTGRWPVTGLVWAAGALVGAVLMFSNSAYRNLAAGKSYQKVQATSGAGAVKDLAIKVLDTLPTYAVVDNMALNAALALLLCLAVAVRGRAGTWSGRLVVVLSGCFLVLTTTLWFVERHRVLPEAARGLAAVAAVLLLAAVVLAALTVVTAPRRRNSLLLFSLAIVLMLGPLALVNPVGPRCFYPTYVVFLVIVSLVAREVADAVPAFDGLAAGLPLLVGALALLTPMFVIYTTMDHAAEHRLERVRAQVAAGHHHVRIRPLPYHQYVHDGDPFWSLLYTRYKTYYGLPADLDLRLEPNPYLAKKP